MGRKTMSKRSASMTCKSNWMKQMLNWQKHKQQHNDIITVSLCQMVANRGGAGDFRGRAGCCLELGEPTVAVCCCGYVVNNGISIQCLPRCMEKSGKVDMRLL